MLAASVSAELLKMRRRAPVWLIMAIWVALSLLFTYVLPYIQARKAAAGGLPQSLLPAHLATTALTGYSFWGGSLVLILGVIWVGSEFGWDTWKTLFTLRPRRLVVLGAQLAVLEAALAVLVVAAYAACAITSVVLARAAGAPIALPGASALAASMAAAWLLMSMWGAIGAALAMLTRGTALAIGLGLVWALAVQNLVGAFTGSIPFLLSLDRLFPGTGGESVIAAVGGTEASATLSAARAFATVAAYLVASCLVAGWLGARRDVV